MGIGPIIKCTDPDGDNVVIKIDDVLGGDKMFILPWIQLALRKPLDYEVRYHKISNKCPPP